MCVRFVGLLAQGFRQQCVLHLHMLTQEKKNTRMWVHRCPEQVSNTLFQCQHKKPPWSTQRLWSEFGIIKEVFSYSCLRFLWSSSVRIVQCLCTTQMTNTGNILLWPSHFSLLWSAMQSSYSPKSDWWFYFVTRQTICICDWVLLWRPREDSCMKIQVCWDAVSFWVVNSKHDQLGLLEHEN